ncbi:MAG: winged helix-turn-helix transcriptional regulator [Candidatus Thermoplasmatota archaeon]
MKSKKILLIIWSFPILFLLFPGFVSACFSPTDSFAFEVLLNKPEIKYDLSPFVNATHVTNQNGTIIYRSHYNKDVAVLLYEINKNLSLRLQIPTKSVVDNNQTTLQPIDDSLKSFDFKNGTKKELEWLRENEVIFGLNDSDIGQISEIAKAGLAGHNSRVVWENEWKPYYKTNSPMLLRKQGEGLAEGIDSCGELNMGSLPEGDVTFGKTISPTKKTPKVVVRVPTEIIAFLTVTGIILCLFFGGTEVGRYRFLSIMLVPILLYTKLKKETVLDHYTRGRIHGFIEANPGAHYNLIKRALNISNGALSYHLRVLENNNLIKHSNDGFKERFYPIHAKIPTIPYLSKIEESILEEIRNMPGISQKELKAKLNLSQPLVSYYTTKLTDLGFLEVVKEGKEVKYYLIEKKEGG